MHCGGRPWLKHNLLVIACVMGLTLTRFHIWRSLEGGIGVTAWAPLWPGLLGCFLGSWLFTRLHKMHALLNIECEGVQHHAIKLQVAAKLHAMKERPRRVIWLRHGESEGHVDSSAYSNIPDNAMPLTEVGFMQAQEAGARLRELVREESAFFIVSPYKRTMMTLRGLRDGGRFWDVAKYPEMQEVKIREQEFGNFQDPEQMKLYAEERNKFGRFWFRFPNGESGADVYSRVSGFIGTLFRWMHRNQEAKFQNFVVVTHGLTMRLAMMRYYRWSVEDFEGVWNPGPCDFWIMELKPNNEYAISNPEMFSYGQEKLPLPRKLRYPFQSNLAEEMADAMSDMDSPLPSMYLRLEKRRRVERRHRRRSKSF